VTDEERKIKCMGHAIDVYRKAVIQLFVDATSGQRKTMDKNDVAAITGRAHDDANLWLRRAKGQQ